MEVGKLAHSHSQPGGMDRTPPGTPKKGGKMLAVRVQMLDDSVTMFQVQAKALGRVLFDQVCNQLNLLESDYFGLEYQEAGGTKYWLDLEKPLCRQIGLSLVDTLVRFCVKFYTPDPSQLEEEFTRYLFCLQIKRDLSQGLLQCNNNTAALMASYIVQAECGDYVVEDYPDHRYLSSYKFVPNQDQELERRIMENHKKHAGQSPAEADLNLLETARRCELYGIKMHPAKDHEGCPLNLAVAHMGIVVFQNYLKINTFSWGKIRKISFKRKRFLVKLHPEGYGYYKDTVEFFFEGRNECKNFWKKCVENHGFFRCTMVKKVPRQKTRVLSRGSSFRYSGRTQKQIVDFVRENYVKRQTFQRSQSFRHSSSAHSSVANVGTSISAHPLLPLGDNAVAGTPASLSCGSMTLTSSPVHTADIHAGASPSPPLTTSVSPGTSVTSSPQHFYPQETPYRRAGHRPTKVKYPPVRSHHAISPLLSPTDAATPASNHSANHSNNVVIVDGNDIMGSRNSLKSPEFVDFNDVYSNCYTSLRSLGIPIDSNIINEETKTDIFSLPCDLLNSVNNTNEYSGPLSKKSKSPFSRDDFDANEYTWRRSSSCKELYRVAKISIENKNDSNSVVGMEPSHESGAACPVKRAYEKSVRKCYSGVNSKNPSIDRTGGPGNDMRIFPSNYPGTASSLSTESADGDLDHRIVEILDAKYDSQEDIVLSHDDISHDSYELLERELNDFNDESSRNKRCRIIGDNERTRSCSWGSDRGISPMDFRSSENVLGSGFDVAKEQNFWSLERENSVKHKSEIDFRSFTYRSSRGFSNLAYQFEGNSHEGVERKGIMTEFFGYDNRLGKRNRETDNETDEAENKKNQVEKRMFGSKGGGDKELGKSGFQDIKVRRASREEKENFEGKRYQGRRKSFDELSGSQEFSMMEISGRMDERKRGEKRREKREKEERFHEGFREKDQREWGRERRQNAQRDGFGDMESRGMDEPGRKIMPKSGEYGNFQEIHFKKFERVVSNQFGKYPEFLTVENNREFLAQEKKVMDNYEKVCQVSRLAKEMKKNEKNSILDSGPSETLQENILKMNQQNVNNIGPISQDFQDWKKSFVELATSPKVGRAHVERTKSDPYNAVKNHKRNILMHQKSIDLTPQQSEETGSDYDHEDGLKKVASRSEHDIPYILHKRHCMNGTARNSEVTFCKTDFKMTFGCKVSKPTENKPNDEDSKISLVGGTPKISRLEEVMKIVQKPPCAKAAEAKKAGVEIINLDLKNGKNPVQISETKKFQGKISKPSTGKRHSTLEVKPTSPKSVSKREMKKVERSLELSGISSKGKNASNVEKSHKNNEETYTKSSENEDPIYAEVCADKIISDEESAWSQKIIPPNPPKRTSSFSPIQPSEEKLIRAQKKITEKTSSMKKFSLLEIGETPTKMAFAQDEIIKKPLEVEELEKNAAVSKVQDPKTVSNFKGGSKGGKAGDIGNSQSVFSRSRQETTYSSSVHQRREESLTLFARTRLGLSEGSAFAPIVRQGRVGSPSSQRRAKSLDAPYVSVHNLPPVDAFSSKDDTLDGSEGDIVESAVARFEELCKGETKKDWCIKNGDEGGPIFGELGLGNTESEVDSVFTDDTEMENNFKKIIENQSKVEISFTEEKVLDGVRGKRLLSKIESVDFIDSEGDMDSSKIAEPPPIPSDRLVNLPESIRFPSVRQISGQTSEESADGWDQREVKVKRRTPRRSVGREEQQDIKSKESVVWDSKDEEPPDDDIWDDNLAPNGGKYDGIVVNVGLPAEYLKRGSCGQSIDDDNLSTPMKESSPEHWVSVDDLPEALEKEEKLLKQQEKILREKILNEKLKRELNLDTIDVDERYCDYKDGLKQSRYEDEPMSLKENFKGHSLDTYELNEKKIREKIGNKNSSLDEELLVNKLLNSYGDVDTKEKLSLRSRNYQGGLDYIQCKVVNDIAEIDQFGDNDEELEEFFVVLDENLDKDGRSMTWDDDTFRRTLSNDESLISVPEEFKDVEKEDEVFRPETESLVFQGEGGESVEIRFGGVQGKEEVLMKGNMSLDEKFKSSGSHNENGDLLSQENKLCVSEGGNLEDFKTGAVVVDVDRLSPFGESRRSSTENQKFSLTDDTGRLSPYDNSSRRSSDGPRRCSASEDADRLSPFNDSRRGSEDPRRLSTSEDSRKCSMSESVSEETRRRLSSAEETRRKRASLTKQCSVGAESLSDEVITGIQECNSSFEHDEKDVFESETGCVESDRMVFETPGSDVKNHGALGDKSKDQTSLQIGILQVRRTEKEFFEEITTANDIVEFTTESAVVKEVNKSVHLEPPVNEREFSKETEDSIDYGEGDFKDISEAVKEKDISGGVISDNEPMQQSHIQKLRISFEKGDSSEGDELRFIDEKRGSTPEILMGKSREAVAVSIVVVNEGISVLNKINGNHRGSTDDAKIKSLPGYNADVVELEKSFGHHKQRHTLPKSISKPKPLTPKPVDYVHRKLMKPLPEIKLKASLSPDGDSNKESVNFLKSSLDSSQESDLDRLSDLSLISHVQNQIVKRNLADTGRYLRKDEIFQVESDSRTTCLERELVLVNQKVFSDDKDKTESSSFEMKSSADELTVGEDAKLKNAKSEKRSCLKYGFESSNKGRKEGSTGGTKEKRSPDQEKRDSGEDGSSSSSAPLYPKRELSSTWKPFLLESSGSSSLEEGWLPPDESAHLADEEETSSTSNNQQDDSCNDDVDYPTGVGYPVLGMTSAEIIVGGYGSVYALSRTLSRISERSTSEQERSDLEDDITKPTSRSVSVEEESIMSSDHQPSLSSDPPSPKETSSTIPDLPVDKPVVMSLLETSEHEKAVSEPFGDIIPPPLPEEDWPSPPSSFSIIDTRVVSHIETFYMEIHPEEACKVVVPEPHGEGNSSSDENQTLLEESEFLHLSSDNMSASTTTTTQDGTVVIPVRPVHGRTGSLSEDASIISTSEWSSPTSGKPRPLPIMSAHEDASDRSKISGWQDHQVLPSGADSSHSENWPTSPLKYCCDSYFEQDLQISKNSSKIKPLKLPSPTGKTFGFFETPVSKVRSPTSQKKYFDGPDRGASASSALRSPTSLSETTSPKNYGRFFDCPASQVLIKSESCERRTLRSPTKGKSVQRGVCTPYYSNVADSAERSYFGRYDTGSLERTKIQSSRKYCSYYSVSRALPNEGDSSNSDGPPASSPNTIPRASKKTKRRHRVALDLVIRNGKIVAPPKTKATILENSDSDRSSPKSYHVPELRKKHSDV